MNINQKKMVGLLLGILGACLSAYNTTQSYKASGKGTSYLHISQRLKYSHILLKKPEKDSGAEPLTWAEALKTNHPGHRPHANYPDPRVQVGTARVMVGNLKGDANEDSEWCRHGLVHARVILSFTLIIRRLNAGHGFSLMSRVLMSRVKARSRSLSEIIVISISVTVGLAEGKR